MLSILIIHTNHIAIYKVHSIYENNFQCKVYYYQISGCKRLSSLSCLFLQVTRRIIFNGSFKKPFCFLYTKSHCNTFIDVQLSEKHQVTQNKHKNMVKYFTIYTTFQRIWCLFVNIVIVVFFIFTYSIYYEIFRSLIWSLSRNNAVCCNE